MAFDFRNLSSDFRTGLLVVAPAANNAVLALAAFVITPGDFGNNPGLCYQTVGIAFIGVLATVIGFAISDIGPHRTLLTVVFQGVVLIFVFAGIFCGYGLMADGKQLSMINDRASALYFSIVTWTTLGYGDLAPPQPIRLVAAIEALLGYTFFGVAVGLGTFLLCKEGDN